MFYSVEPNPDRRDPRKFSVVRYPTARHAAQRMSGFRLYVMRDHSEASAYAANLNRVEREIPEPYGER